MLVHVPDVLDALELAQCRERLADARWLDGRKTAGYQSAQAKNNGQLDEDDPAEAALTYRGALDAAPRHPELLRALLFIL